jgi:formylmethanofuran dehydrogenase subunit B
MSLLRDGGNRSGADAVMTSQTGYPMAVDFARGFPRFRPYDATAPALLAGGRVDAVVVVGSMDQVPEPLSSSMRRLRRVVCGPRASEADAGASVAIDTGVAGVHDAGTALRMDDVPVRLRPSIVGPSSAADVVRRLGVRVAAR